MDILEYLIKDHDELRRKLDLVGRALQDERFSEALQAFLVHLEIHEEIEEEILLPRIEQIREHGSHDLSFDYEQDHTELWRKLGQLRDSLYAGSKTWSKRTFHEIVAYCIAHMRGEEQVLYPLARRFISQEELDLMGKRALAASQDFSHRMEGIKG